jgi:hypothetical protein
MADGPLAELGGAPGPMPRRSLALVPSGPSADSDRGRSGQYAHTACRHEGAPGTCQQRECRYHLAIPRILGAPAHAHP